MFGEAWAGATSPIDVCDGVPAPAQQAPASLRDRVVYARRVDQDIRFDLASSPDTIAVEAVQVQVISNPRATSYIPIVFPCQR